MARNTATKTDTRLAARLAAIASLGAAVIHFAVAPTHWQEWMPSGMFFVSLALCQLMWARAVLTRPIAPVLAAGIVLNVGAMALWAVSRTAGAPIGPHSGVPEVVQAADLCALLLQVYVVMGAGWVWHRGRREQRIHAFANAIVLVGAATVVALASTVGVASGIRPGHHGPAAAESDHHGPETEQVDDHHGHSEPANPPSIPEPTEPSTAPAPAPVSDGAPPPAAVPLNDGHVDHHHDE